MATKAGQIVINIRGGTANLQSDLNQASNAFKKFGHNSVSSVQATSGALRVLEGNVTNNLRAAERFLASIPAIGNALKAAFPIVGAVALLGVLGEMSKKAYDAFKTFQEGPEKARNAFNQLSTSLDTTNAGLAVSNARLENEIAKLQGKPTNNLKVALLEAVEAADKLKKSLDGDLKSLYDLIETQKGGTLQRVGDWFQGADNLSDLQKKLGGYTGFGGHSQELQAAMDQGLKAIKAAATPEASKAAQEALRKQVDAIFDAAQKEIFSKQNELKTKQAVGLSPLSVLGAVFSPGTAPHLGTDQARSLEDLSQAQRVLQQMREGAMQRINASELTQKRDILQGNADNAKADRPFENRLAELNAQLDGVKAKMDAVGQSESAKVLAEGYAAYVKVMTEVNDRLKEHGRQLDDNQKGELHAAEIAIALTEAESKWKEKFTQSTDAIKDRIAQQTRLNAAIGGTYSQQRAAAVENNLIGAVGAENYNDPEFRRTHAADIERLRSQLETEYDTQAQGRNDSALQQLSDRIRLTNAMAAAEKDGAQAVRQAELEERIRVATRGLDADAAARLAAAMREESAAELAQQSEKELATLREKAMAADRLANAYGRVARVQAEAQNAYDAAIQAGKSPAVAQAEAQAILQKSQDEIQTRAGELATSYTDQLAIINQTAAALQNIQKTQGDSLQIEQALRDLDDQRLKLAADLDLKQDSALAGVHAFFTEIQEQAETTAKIINTALNAALSQTSNNLATMLTGKRPKGGWGAMWGKEFESIGHNLTQSTIQKGLQTGLGALGKQFPGLSGLTGLIGGGKPDGSQGRPFYVKSVDRASGSAGGWGFGGEDEDDSGADDSDNAVPNPLRSLGGLFGDGSLGGGIFSIFKQASNIASMIPGLADGGDVYSGGLTMVGEQGPEVLNLPGGSRVTPLNKLGTSDTHNHYYTIDARGAELGVENRISSAIDQARADAAKTAIRGSAEREKRTVQRTGRG